MLKKENRKLYAITVMVVIMLCSTCASLFGQSAQTDRGDACLQRREWDQAIVEYNAALRINPRYYPALANRGIAYARKRDHDRAIADFTAALRIAPNTASILYNRGLEYFNTGDYDRAIEDFTAVLCIEPNNSNSRTMLSRAEAERADLPQNVVTVSEADLRVQATQDGRGVVILGYSGSATNIRIPDTIQGMPVQEIGNSCFGSHNGLSASLITSVILPSTIVRIGERAFAYSALRSITLPNGITIIEDSTFANCSALRSITLPERLTTIRNNAFVNCSALRSITLPNSVTSIGSSAFKESGLTSITIPNSVTSIGSSAFERSGLTSITWTPRITRIGASMFWGCTKLQTVVIPEGVTEILAAFGGCTALTSVTLPSTIRIISGDAYVTDLGAFSNCSSLTTITIPDSVRSISFYPSSFSGCSSLPLATQGVLRRLGYTGNF